MPVKFPSSDQSLFITGSLLKDPLVADALEYVNQVVDPKYLKYKPSTYIQWSTVTYHEDASETCYWPDGLCTRDFDTDNFRADVVKCPNPNDWGLTYDDGPSVTGNGDDTPALRLALKAAGNIKASFFVTGASVQNSPQEIINLYKDGHQIAAHSWTHHPLTSLSNAQIVAELKYTEALIYKTIGIVVKHFRPPYGDIDDRVRAIASALGYKAIMWTTAPTRDSADASVDATDAESARLLKNIKDTWFKAQPGYVSLQHDITPFVSSLAIKVMEEIKKIGLKNLPVYPKTVAACIGDNDWYHRFPTHTTTTTTTPAPTPTTKPIGSTKTVLTSTVPATATEIDGVNELPIRSSSPANTANFFLIGLVTMLLLLAASFLI
jgi:peptidoglycan/xylan/chitin deacetylase (PgdA/CDA1 family)